MNLNLENQKLKVYIDELRNAAFATLIHRYREDNDVEELSNDEIADRLKTEYLQSKNDEKLKQILSYGIWPATNLLMKIFEYESISSS